MNDDVAGLVAAFQTGNAVVLPSDEELARGAVREAADLTVVMLLEGKITNPGRVMERVAQAIQRTGVDLDQPNYLWV